MPDYSKRTGYAPWSLTREAGVQSATVNGTIEVPQTCQPTINTGVIDEKGNWQGVKANDEVFIGISKAEAIANTSNALFPDTPNFPSIDMTGFQHLVIAIKPTENGDHAIRAVMGPDTTPFANLTPVVANAMLRGAISAETTPAIVDLLGDNAETLTADKWNIFTIQNSFVGQKNMQIRIQNNTGSINTIEFAFMRLVK
tara:strand:- start:84 stop:680 length:597 start_codon:yes stop_codon:yes gene_type:complete